jgi:uncharacterized hydrophobic protein (TIGR00271 family)
MVHLRIVVPSYQAEHALDLLKATPSVCNVIYLERAARRPEGDVILCDIAREDASVVISDLRELEIDREGSIAIEKIDSQISAFAQQAERAAPGLAADAVVWEEVEARTSEEVELSATFVAFMVLAMLIAMVGIFTDQLLLIIGAMIVGPEFGPIAGLCVAAVERRRPLARRSLSALAIGFPVGIMVTFLAALAINALDLVPHGYSHDSGQLFTQFISSPNGWSFIVAFLAGIAGMLSLTSAKSGALVGVLVSVTTIPAAANIGVAAALGDWDQWTGAMEQLSLNLAAILLAGVGTLFVQRRLYLRRRVRHLHDEAREAAGLPLGKSRRRARKAAAASAARSR